MKLEQQLLTPYIDHKLKVYCTVDERERLMNLGQGSSLHWIGIKAIINYYKSGKFIHIPMVRPLSQILEPIMHEGRVITPINTLALNIDEFRENPEKNYPGSEGYHFRILNTWYCWDQLPYWRIQILLSWHFDLFGLIPAGIGKSIPSIKESKYEQ
ncbi:MAG: hypothetical protein AAF634_05045 [Bacteroidota bacterium]